MAELPKVDSAGLRGAKKAALEKLGYRKVPVKTVTLPVSDCGCFLAGRLDGEIRPDHMEGELPKYGVVIWYHDQEIASQACLAIAKCDAMFE